MARSGETYRKLAPGIYAVYVGRRKVAVRANVRVKGTLYHSPRFAPDTNLTVAKVWQENQRVEGRKVVAPAPATPEGFAADAARYLKTVAAMPSYDDRERDINAWIAVFGVTPRGRITTAQIAEHLARWRKQWSASTVNHRRTALLHLWRVLDGKSAANPVTDIPKFREPAPEPRSVPAPIIRAIFAAMPDTVTRARLQVIAYTGMAHSMIARLTARDLDLDHAVYVRPERHKGRGTKRQALPLTADGVAALQALVAHGGLGQVFSRSSLHSSFRRACDKVQAATGYDLTGVRPYDLRHSFGTQAYASLGDERAVQQLLGHAKIETTHRYTLGGVDARLRATIEAMNQTPKVPHQSSPPQKA